jgi:uncharacterized membrane protein HdeD (DUF308 family)
MSPFPPQIGGHRTNHPKTGNAQDCPHPRNRKDNKNMPQRAKWILWIGTIAIALMEWSLFELLRAPYRPPEDMRTLLGTEKYSLPYVIAMVGIAWAVVSIWLLVTSRPTLRDLLAFMTLIALLLSLFTFVLKTPPWPVTPPELLWR